MDLIREVVMGLMVEDFINFLSNLIFRVNKMRDVEYLCKLLIESSVICVVYGRNVFFEFFFVGLGN